MKHQVKGGVAMEDSYVHNGKVPISGTYDEGDPFEGRKTCVVRRMCGDGGLVTL